MTYKGYRRIMVVSKDIKGVYIIMNKSEKLNLTLKPKVLETLNAMADEYGMSRSAFITMLVMNKQEQQQAMESVRLADGLQRSQSVLNG